jgi:hypothetical protein
VGKARIRYFVFAEQQKEYRRRDADNGNRP